MSKTKPKKTVTKPKVSAEEAYKRWLDRLMPGQEVAIVNTEPKYSDNVFEGRVVGATGNLLFVQYQGQSECRMFSLDTGCYLHNEAVKMFPLNHDMVTVPRARNHFKKMGHWMSEQSSTLPIDIIREILAVVDKYEAKKKA